ncbi:MAG: DUF1552 domain-containing protein [Polyangiales bacterium]|nr:DUF1552 domain-containing protein [Myxococcales bacterium]
MSSHSSSNRRTFMRRVALGGGAAALFPWLNRARAATPPTKLLLVFTPHGTVWDSWRPGGGETNFTFSPILNPLAKHRDKLLIVDGLSMVTGTSYYIPHTYTMPVLWTGSPIDTKTSQFCRDDHGQCFGWNTGVSVDQTIAGRLQGPEPFKSIELGYNTSGLHPANRMIYAGPAQPKTPISDPATTFSTLFGTVSPDEVQAEKDARRRKSVLDAVLADFNSRKGKLSAADKARLEAHATSVHELEQTLAADTKQCARPGAPSNVSSETAMDLQSNLIASALGCGLTRVASFQLRIADNDNSLYPWLGINASGHHSLSHDSSAATQAKLAGLYTWYSERVAHLLDQLAATPDGDGSSVLDNTLVVWASELGQAWNHDIKNIPVVLAGGANTKLRGGRYLKVTNARMNRLLVTALHSMGFSDTSYGSLDNGTGPIPGALSS